MKDKRIIKSLVVILTAIILFTSCIFLISLNNKKIDNNTDNKVAVTMSAIETEDFAEYGIPETAEKAYLVTVITEPIDAIDSFIWTITGNEDEAITIIPSSDTKSAVIVCNTDFDVIKTVTVKSIINEELTANLTVNYEQKIDISFDVDVVITSDLTNDGIALSELYYVKDYVIGEMVTDYTGEGIWYDSIFIKSKLEVTKGTKATTTESYSIEDIKYYIELTDEAKQVYRKYYPNARLQPYELETNLTSNYNGGYSIVEQELTNYDYYTEFFCWDYEYVLNRGENCMAWDFNQNLKNDLKNLFNNDKPYYKFYVELKGVKQKEKSYKVNFIT